MILLQFGTILLQFETILLHFRYAEGHASYEIRHMPPLTPVPHFVCTVVRPRRNRARTRLYDETLVWFFLHEFFMDFHSETCSEKLSMRYGRFLPFRKATDE